MIDPGAVVTFRELAGYEIVRTVGHVRAEAACGRDRWRATLRSIGMMIGLVRVEQTPETKRARDASLSELVERAAHLGANGVIGVTFDSSEDPDGTMRVIAYGEAVVLSPEPGAGG